MPQGHYPTNCALLRMGREVPHRCFPTTIPTSLAPATMGGLNSNASLVICLSAKCGQPKTIKVFPWPREGHTLRVPPDQEHSNSGQSMTSKHTHYTTHQNTMEHKQKTTETSNQCALKQQTDILRASSV